MKQSLPFRLKGLPAEWVDPDSREEGLKPH
jgi:hypothetical protein